MSVLGLGSADLGIGLDRDLLQRRLVIYLRLLAWMGLGMWILEQLTRALIEPSRLVAGLSSPVGYLRPIYALVLLGLVTLLRRRTFSTWTLESLDAALLLGPGVLIGLMPMLAHSPLRPEFAAMLALSVLLFVRAAIVPSHAQRTWILGVLVTAPVVAVTWRMHSAPDRPAEWPAREVMVSSAMLWALAVATASAVVSHVIYGLQRQVREALQLGQYTLEEKIGEGGMGVVYRARHALLRRPTAIKLMRAEGNERAVARFEREVTVTSQLTHPNTIAIYDYGQSDGGLFYYVMEYLDGFDLERIVQAEGPLPAGRVVRIVRQIAGALAEAHGAGLVHRDVKPSNIVLCERGGVPDFVKVLDFGLVREIDTQQASPANSLQDVLRGTPLYMSPEQIVSPASLDARSDLYSLGAVAYFLLTGMPVFEGRNVVEVCGHHLHSTPVPPSVRAGLPVPASLEALVLRLLAKSPDERPTDARELVDLLDALDDVPPWSEASARAWWIERGPALCKGSHEVDPVRQTLAIDLGRRAGGE